MKSGDSFHWETGERNKQTQGVHHIGFSRLFEISITERKSFLRYKMKLDGSVREFKMPFVLILEAQAAAGMLQHLAGKGLVHLVPLTDDWEGAPYTIPGEGVPYTNPAEGK